MRKFILHNKEKTLSFDLSKNVIVAEPKGLGNKFSLAYLETNSGKRLSNITPDFEPIQLPLYFNVNGKNGYANYKNFSNFLAACGLKPIILEYQDGITKKFCEVVFENLPKSEPNKDGEFKEDFTFQRQTYWYEEIEESFELKSTAADATDFPLSFPFTFKGLVFKNTHRTNNKFIIAAPVIFRISGEIENPITLYVDNAITGERIGEIEFSINNEDGTEIVIDPTTNKITQITDDETINAYGFVNHNKQSFLFVPQGEYIIGCNLSSADAGKIELTIKRYLLD